MSLEAFKIEQHGVDAVPKSERTKSWWDLFVIQAGVNITLSSLLLGGLLDRTTVRASPDYTTSSQRMSIETLPCCPGSSRFTR